MSKEEKIEQEVLDKKLVWPKYRFIIINLLAIVSFFLIIKPIFFPKLI